jgi:hypothetical protein
MAEVKTEEQFTASMPTFKFGFIDPQGQPHLVDSRVAHLDSGCNCNLISQKTLSRDLKLFGPQARLVKIRPFQLNLAYGKSKTVAMT